MTLPVPPSTPGGRAPRAAGTAARFPRSAAAIPPAAARAPATAAAGGSASPAEGPEGGRSAGEIAPGLRPGENPGRAPASTARVKLLNYDHDALSLRQPQRLSQANDEAAAFHLHREWADCEVVARFTVDGEPVSKARARFTSYGSTTRTYTPAKTVQAERVFGWKFRAAARGHKLDPDATYGVVALFFAGTRQRRDVDNMLKAVLDGLNGVAWVDDSQVVEVSGRKTFDPDHPDWARTEVLVYKVGSIRQRTAMCSFCGRDYSTYECLKDRSHFCSKACANDARRAGPKTTVCPSCRIEFVKGDSKQVYCSVECQGRRVVVNCTGCGKSFSKQSCHVRAVNYCSPDCRSAAYRELGHKRADGICETCGGPTSKKKYRQCRGCISDGKAVMGKPKVADKARLPATATSGGDAA